MVRKWRIFGDFLRPVFSASSVQHISDLDSNSVLHEGQHPLTGQRAANFRPLANQ